MKKLIVAIDGPAGAGKSTIAKQVAEQLGYIYLDTGAMYRAVTLRLLNTGKAFTPELATQMAEEAKITFKREPGLNRVFLDNDEVTEAIRSQAVTTNVSAVSAVAGVREAMVNAQRKLGEAGGVVLDGRDIGTVVFPQAEVKVFLTASVEVRAKRRFLELEQKGQSVDLKELEAGIAKRDKMDSEREVSPLKCAEDAHYLDTSTMNIEEVVTAILNLCERI